MAGVVVLGSLNIDLVAEVARFPAVGETLFGRTLTRLPGGKGANQAMAAAEAGRGPVRLIGRVGADEGGRQYLTELGRRGVDVAGVAVDPDDLTGHAVITVDEAGENTIIVISGANAGVGPTEVDRLALLAGDVLLMQLEIPVAAARSAIEVAATAGARVLLNLSPYQPLAPTVLAQCHAIIVNETEAAQLGPDAVDPDKLIVTLGAAGAHWGSTHRDAKPTTVLDTTGAGDAFAGALAAALAAGETRADCLAAAAHAAAQCVQRRGAQGWTF